MPSSRASIRCTTVGTPLAAAVSRMPTGPIPSGLCIQITSGRQASSIAASAAALPTCTPPAEA